MSGATQAREKRAKTRGDFYCERPADVPANSAVPHYAWLVQHALIMSCAIVLKAIWSLKPRPLRPNNQGVEQGALLKDASITRIAKATARYTNPLSDAYGEPMPRRTVGHCIAKLKQKGFIVPWESETHPLTSPTGTSYRIRTYDEVLQRWADDPRIGTVGKRAFYVIGKGRRHLSPEELIAWKLDHARAEKFGAAAVVELSEPSIITSTDPDPEVPLVEPGRFETPAQHAVAAASARIPDAAVILQAILAERVDATEAFAAELFALARSTEPSIPATSIALLVAEMATDWRAKQRASRNPQPFLNIGWFKTGMSAAVTRWRFERDRAQQATGTGGGFYDSGA